MVKVLVAGIPKTFRVTANYSHIKLLPKPLLQIFPFTPDVLIELVLKMRIISQTESSQAERLSRKLFIWHPFSLLVMVSRKEKGGKTLYSCSECGFLYRQKYLAQKCEDWCTEKKSCNLEIIRYAVNDE